MYANTVPFYRRTSCFHGFWYPSGVLEPIPPQIPRDDCICFYLRTSKVVEFHLKNIIKLKKISTYCGIRDACSKNIYTELLPFCMCMYMRMYVYIFTHNVCTYISTYMCVGVRVLVHG